MAGSATLVYLTATRISDVDDVRAYMHDQSCAKVYTREKEQAKETSAFVGLMRVDCAHHATASLPSLPNSRRAPARDC